MAVRTILDFLELNEIQIVEIYIFMYIKYIYLMVNYQKSIF